MTGSARRSAPRLLVMLAMLAALAWQSLAVQTHVHPGAGTAWRLAQASARPGAAALHADPRDRTPECSLCRELGLSGSFLSPDATVLRLAAAAFDPPVFARLRTQRGRQPSHAWRSRGPPTGIRAS